MDSENSTNLWFDVGNACLISAQSLLKKEATPSAATVRVVSELVNIAIAIDRLNLSWEVETRSGGEVLRAQPSS